MGGEFSRRSPHGCVWPAGWWRPHASVWAIWSRLCDTNVLTSRSARALLGETGAFTSVFYAREDAPWLLEANTLDENQRRFACAAAWAFDSDVVERRWLRYCPACLAASYHAACFQHRAVSRCPVHGLPLLDRCARCGGWVGVTYEAARSVPFGCGKCASRLARRGAVELSAAEIVAITATTAALTSSEAVMSRVEKSTVGSVQGSAEAGHARWWFGIDPFVQGSQWRPHCARVALGHRDELDAQAWSTLIRFVEGRLGDPMLTERMLLVAEGVERRNRCMPSVTLSVPEWAAAALVARYGTADYRRAVRLTRHGCSPALFPFTPQASTIVVTSSAANAIVFAAEVREEFLRLLKWTGRHGPDALIDADLAADATRVNWCLIRQEEGTGDLQWRGRSEVQFARLCQCRFRQRPC